MGDIPRVEGTTVKSRYLLTSVGCSAIDDLLGGGLPVAGIYVIDERNTRLYSSVLEKLFLAEGVCHKHDILLATPQMRDSEDLKKLPARVMVDTKRNGDFRNSNGAVGDSLKIAWRYSVVPTIQPTTSTKGSSLFDLSKHMEPDLVKQCDVLIYPSEHPDDSSSCSYASFYRIAAQKLRSSKHSFLFGSNSKKLLRIVIEDFATPLWEDSEDALRFLACLRALVSESLAVVMIILNSSAVDSIIKEKIFCYCDAVFCLETAEQELEKNNIEERFDGYFKIVRLPGLVSIATNCPVNTDLTFELRRKSFEIRVLHLPPALGEAEKKHNTGISCTSMINEF